MLPPFSPWDQVVDVCRAEVIPSGQHEAAAINSANPNAQHIVVSPQSA